MTRPMPEAHVPLLWQALQQHTLYDVRRKRTTYNFKCVSDHSEEICGVHWSEVTVRTIPKRRLMPQGGKPQNQPEAILLRISRLFSDPARSVAELSQADILRTVNADGGPEIKRASFQRLLPSTLGLLPSAPPNAETQTVRYCDPSVEDMNELITQIRFKSRSVVRVGAYVLTLKPLVAALLDLRQERPSVEVRILYDQKFCSSSTLELEAIVALAEAGATVKHLRSYSMHIKMVCVDSVYCWSGSGNFGVNAITRNAELNTEIKGNVVTACDSFDKYFNPAGTEIRNDDGDTKWHLSVQPTEAELQVLVSKAQRLRFNAKLILQNKKILAWLKATGRLGEIQEDESEDEDDYGESYSGEIAQISNL